MKRRTAQDAYVCRSYAEVAEEWYQRSGQRLTRVRIEAIEKAARRKVAAALLRMAAYHPAGRGAD